MSDNVQALTVSAPTTPEIIVSLKSRFMKYGTYHRIDQQFRRAVELREAILVSGKTMEVNGLAIVGASGAGKTTTLAKVFSSYAASLPPGGAPCNILSLRTPSPSTLKSVGFEIVKKLGFPMQKVPTEATIWSMVRSMLKAQQIAVLHLDEAQDIVGKNRAGDINAVVNTMKSLMQQEDWPIVLVLSGTEDLRTLINSDPQLSRRLAPIMFDQLTMSNDQHDVAGTLENFAKLAGLKLADVLHTEDFIERLIHAAAHEMGVLIEIIIGAIEDAMNQKQKHLKLDNFAEIFARRSNNPTDLNPFLSDYWRALNPRTVMMREEPEHQ